MSQDLQMTISARDNASRVVEGVEKRIKTFGVQFGQQLAGMLAPMALVGMAIGKIGAKIDEIRQQRKEAFDWGASLQASANKMGVTVEQFQAIEEAANETDESVEKVGKSFKLASDLIAAAKSGSLEAAEALSALGFDISKLETITAQDVLGKLAGALSSTEDPAERAKIAVAALGKEAANLQATLAKGFDIAGAMEGIETLSREEAALLREQAKNERKEAMDKRRKEAKRQATETFLEEDPEGRALVEAERERIVRLAIPGASLGATAVTAGALAGQEDFQTRVGAILRRRQEEQDAKKKAEADKKAEEERKKAEALKEIADKKAKEEKEKEEQEKPKKKPKEIKSKTSPLEFTEASQPTVSSLRAIGGGMAGEVAGLVDFQRNSLEVQKQIRDILAEIKAKGNIMNTDFTKPASGPSNGGYVPPITLPNRPSLTGSTGTMLA